MARMIALVVMLISPLLAVEGQLTTTTDILPSIGSSLTSSLSSSTLLGSSSTSTSTTASSTLSSTMSSSSVAQSSSPSSSISSSTSSSTTTTTTTIASAVSNTSTVPTAPSSTIVNSSTVPSSTTAVLLDLRFPDSNAPDYARVVAAIVGGCGVLLLNTIFFIIVSVLLRYTVRMERHKTSRVGRKSLTGGAVNFYGGQEVQSAQALFAPSLSATNIVSGASDIQLDARAGRGVYVNQGFEPAAGGSSAAFGDNGSSAQLYRPIEIRKSQGGESKI